MKTIFKIEFGGQVEYTNSLGWIDKKIRQNTYIVVTETRNNNIVFAGKRMDF